MLRAPRPHRQVSDGLFALVKSYFLHMVLLVDARDGLESTLTSAKIEDGSTAGIGFRTIPVERNVRRSFSVGAFGKRRTGFADDIIILSVGRHLFEIEAITNVALCLVRNWMGGHGL